MIKSYKWKKVMEEIKKCEPVCANCHTRKTAQQYNWWRLD